jgi:hypothetical protein
MRISPGGIGSSRVVLVAMKHLSAVVDGINVAGTTALPGETGPPLVIDGNTVFGIY